jgi:hypothetical protein
VAWSTVGRKHKDELLTKFGTFVIYSQDGADYSTPSKIYVVTESRRLAHFSRNIIIHSFNVIPT